MLDWIFFFYSRYEFKAESGSLLFRRLYTCDVFNAFKPMFFLDLWKSWFAQSVDPSTNLFFNRAE